MFAKNYRKGSLFEKVMAKIKRCSFFCLTVYVGHMVFMLPMCVVLLYSCVYI